MTFDYRPDVLAQLLLHGVRPATGTRPSAVYRFVSDLYRFELRRLKERRVRHEVPARDYARLVVELRRRYPLVSLPVGEWTVPGTPADPDDVPLC
jgi:hypothetical protein